MATEVLRVCDVCRAPTDEPVIRLGWDLVTYEIDLCPSHAEALVGSIEAILPRARRLGAPARSVDVPTAAAPAASQVPTAKVRAWAKKNGIEIAARGRVPEEVFTAYFASLRHSQEQT